jgi:iron complex outermembrane receptor protein
MNRTVSRRLNRSAATIAILAAAAALPGAAFAQSASGQAAANEPTAPEPSNPVTQNAPAAPADEVMPGDIVVTAQKRVERLQDVPLAVTAVGGDALASRQINDTSSLTQAVPSLTFQQGANPSNTTLRIRGVGTALFSQGVEPSVAVVVDGVVAARQAQGFADFADIDRVEVLRGPQGTLFGRNSTAGVINVVTARPSRTLQGRADVTIAEGDEYRAKGTISGPITDTLRARVTGYYNNVGGYIHNVATNHEVNGSEGYGVRGKLEWDATSNLNLLAIVDYRKNNAACCSSVPYRIVTPALATLTLPVIASPTNRSVKEQPETYANSNQKTYSLQADWDLGFGTITSITAWQDYALDVNQPIDRIAATPTVPFVGAGAAFAAWPRNGGTIDLGNFTQELRLGSNSGRSDAFSYTIGAFYSDLTIDRFFQRRRAVCSAGILGQPCATTPVYQSVESNAHLRGQSLSGFAQAELRLIGGLRALGGLRVQHEKVSVAGTRTTPYVAGDAVFPGTPSLSGKRSADDTAVTGKAGLQYEFSRRLQAYGSYTRGYKGLGFNTEIATNFATQDPVQPEHVNAYEIGAKGRTADGKFALDLAIFRADYSDLQVQANRSDAATGTSQFVQTNAGSSRTQGVEVEATVRPGDTFQLTASVTYADTSVNVNGLNCPLQYQGSAVTATVGNTPINTCYRLSQVVNGATVLGGPVQDIRGGYLPNSPRWRINLAPRYEEEVFGGVSVFVQPVVSFQSRQGNALEQDPLLVQQSYTLVDLSIGLNGPDSRWNATFFVKNLFDTNYTTSLGHNALLATAANPYDIYATYNKDANRYVGGSLGFKF